MKEVAVTVLMPVYNGELFLKEAIDSILYQTFTNFELLIINDGSTDRTKDIILTYNDPRIRYVENEKNIKLISTLNKGIDIAKGKYIARIDADDIALPNRLEVQYFLMENNPEIGLCGSWIQHFGLSNKIIGYKSEHDEIRIELFFNNHIPHSSVMIRSSVLRDNNLKYPFVLHAEDYALWVSMSEFTKFYIIPEVLLKYRIHDESISNINSNFQDDQSSLIRKVQFEKMGINCNNDLYYSFDLWINKNKINSIKQAEEIIKFLCDLYVSISKKEKINQDLLNHFFYKKTWAIVCEYPSFKSFFYIKKNKLINKEVKLIAKIKLLINCIKN